MFKLKIKAGALQLTLGIITIIGLLLLSFVLLVHIHKYYKIQQQFVKGSIVQSNNGIQYSLNNNLSSNDTLTIRNPKSDYKTQKIIKGYWGIFEKIHSKTKIKEKEFQKIALVGGAQKSVNRPVLYLKDNNKPLVLVGNTKIEGTAYLPRQGVKPGTISGQSFYGSKLVHGLIRHQKSLPKITEKTKTNLDRLNSKQLSIQNTNIISIEAGKNYSNSFFNPTQYVISNNLLLLQSVNLTGNILVVSNSKIEVAASSQLKDIVLIAPKIEIKDNVSGYFQAIATKSIVVGKNVHLDYPSALVLNNNDMTVNDNAFKDSYIHINEHSIIKGVILYQAQTLSKNYISQVEILENAKVIGEVYCNDNLLLRGDVYGTVFTNNFLTKAYGSIYQNHLLDTQVSIDSLPEQYIGLKFNNSKRGIAKWLY